MKKEVNKKPVQSMKPQMSEEQKLQEKAQELMKKKVQTAQKEIADVCAKYGVELQIVQNIQIVPKRQ